jgi:hypothetical protein
VVDGSAALDCVSALPNLDFGVLSFSGSVIPAQAGIQRLNLDSRLRGNDKQTLVFMLTRHYPRASVASKMWVETSSIS